MQALKTSEFWMGLIAAILSFLVQQHVLDQQAADFAKMMLVYVVGRIISKAASGGVPFQPNAKGPVGPVVNR